MNKKETNGLIEAIVEVFDKQNSLPGILALTRFSSYYYFVFQQAKDPNNIRQTLAVLTNLQKPVIKDAQNEKNDQPYQLDCQRITTFALTENSEKNIVLSLTHRDFSGQKQYFISSDKIFQMAKLIEKILIRGIAVPKSTFEEPYSLEFYHYCHIKSFISIPSNIQLHNPTFSSLEDFWNNVMKFYKDVLNVLFENDSIPLDPNFPLGIAALSLYMKKHKQMMEFISSYPKYEIMTKESFDSFFDADGKINNLKEFKNTLYIAGASKDILPRVIPFALGVFPSESTSEERIKIDQKLQDDFIKLKNQVQLCSKKQELRNRKLRESFRVIIQDAERTDRACKAFKSRDKPGLSILISLLRCYSIYNPNVSYLQGMNDLFVPLILAFIPNWNDDGDPIDDNGNIYDPSDKEYLIFWSFEAMVKNLNHDKLLSALTERSMQISHEVIKIMGKIEPVIEIWLSHNNLTELLWMYSDFVYLYKRTFSNIWSIWLQMNCSPDPHNWLVYFVSAILLVMFPNIAVMSDLSITMMMDAYPKNLATIDPSEIGKISYWLYENCKLDELNNNEVENDPVLEEFKFEYCEFG
ncbi:hypothetical protein TRFO_40090 [Tritrichomonas foetus]|uniref:Rab-GAP TBC domain-containing protein n=1 Tax=Tritrichomonas foetus TaxID=1144522 RepID=A0A1J4J2D5_9EUKA|nr:hypothetical protein TRFO_40090 [Tritrichomonas foetus]|eukprot:OHS93616.1 hypothetical protein TRFO_40090 [Tritrichomonas foetus]